MGDSIALYFRLLAVSVRGQMQYRASFILMSIGQFFTTGVEALGVWALFDRFGNLTPWTLEQVALFYGTVNVAFAFTDSLARGFDVFGARFVKTGNFDRLLLRPRSSVLQIAGYEMTLHRVGRLAQGLIVMGWAIANLEVDWTAGRVALLLFSLLSTYVFFYGITILQATFSFWATESLEMFNTLTYGGVETASYPMAIYREGFRRFFTYFVPLGCVTYFPLVGVLGAEDPLGSTPLQQAMAPFAGFAFFGVSLVIWRFGVRHYTSTGS